MTLSKVVENSPAEKAGLLIGDKILAENSTALDWKAFVALVQQGQSFTIKVERNQEILPKPCDQKKSRW